MAKGKMKKINLSKVPPMLAFLFGIGAGIAGYGLTNANAQPNFTETKNGEYEIKASNKDFYQSKEANDPRAQAVRLWLTDAALMYSDMSKTQTFSEDLERILQNEKARIEWDLDAGYVKVNAEGMGEKVYDGLQFLEKMEVDEIMDLAAKREQGQTESQSYQQEEKKDEAGQKQEPKNYNAPENPIDKVVSKIKEEQSKPKRTEIKREKKKEAKKEKAKAELKNPYDTVPAERQQEVAEIVRYVFENNNGYVKRYPFDDFESLTNKAVMGMDFSDLKKGLCPTARIFEIFGDAENSKAYIVDMCNDEWKSAVLYNITKNNKIKAVSLLLEKDLNNEVFDYARDKRLKVESLQKVLNNFGNLRRENAKVIRDLKGKYKEGVIFLYVPERKGVSGVTYSIKDNLISEILDLDKDAFFRSAEPSAEIALTNGDNRMKLEALLARDGRISGTRGKANVIYDNNLVKQAQLALELTNNMNEKTVFGGSFFQDKIGNWNYTEGDAFVEYLKNNLNIKFLTGLTNDKTTFDNTPVGSLILKQNREGKSNPLINASVAYTFPGQVPLVWGKPTVKARGATVSGNDSYNYEWQDVNGLSIAQGSVIKPSDYTTAVLGIQNKWGFGKGKTANLAALVESETNDFRQEKNGKMIDNINSQTRVGFIGSYDGNNFKPSLAVIYQTNKDVNGKQKYDLANVVQIAGRPFSNLAVIANAYSEGLNNSRGAGLSVAYSPRAKKYLEHEGNLQRDIAMYNVMNNASLLPEVHPNVPNISPIYEGILASYSAGNDRQGTNFCKATLDFYVGKNCAIGSEYSEQGNDKKSSFKIKKAFR